MGYKYIKMKPVLTWERKLCHHVLFSHLLFHISWCWQTKQCRVPGNFITGSKGPFPDDSTFFSSPCILLSHLGAAVRAEASRKNLFLQREAPRPHSPVLGVGKVFHLLRFKDLQAVLRTQCSHLCCLVCLCALPSDLGPCGWARG